MKKKDTMKEKEKIRQALKELGQTPETIAATLEKAECNGIIGDAERCPVAQWLKKKGFKNVSVEEAVRCNGKRIEMPKPIAAFVERFDAEEFPCLEDHP